jgi:uncharacterized membrane protein YphA (DoxX/SURF4 family)
MADLTLLPEETRPRINMADLMIRLGIAIVFLIAGAEKFSATNPNSHWVSMFNQIGLGEWFRYFTGVVEVLGATLILIPRTVLIGVALLAVTMASAAVIVFCSWPAWRQPIPALILIGPTGVGLETLGQVVCGDQPTIQALPIGPHAPAAAADPPPADPSLPPPRAFCAASWDAEVLAGGFCCSVSPVRSS